MVTEVGMARTPVDQVKEKIASKTPLFQREERHELRYQLSIGLATALSWLMWLTPSSIRTRLCYAVAGIFLRSSRTYRENVEANVRQALGDAATDDEVNRTVRSIFRNSALNFMDLLLMPRRSKRSFLRNSQLTAGGWSTIDDAIAQKRGVIFVSAHIGCFDYIGHAFYARGLDLTVVTGRTTSRFIFDGVTYLRGAQGVSLVEPTPSGVRSVYRKLRSGACAVFLSDRDFFQNGREVTFFGQPTTLPPGVVRIARDTGAIVIPVFSRRGRRKHELQIMEPITIEKTKDVDADVRQGLQRIAGFLERGVRASLDQWVLFQRVWPERPPEAMRVFPVGSPLESDLLERVASALPERKQSTSRQDRPGSDPEE